MIFDGILIGIGSFFIIGVLHPVVIGAEYHFGKGVWPLFLAAGLLCLFGSLFVGSIRFSVFLGVLGCSLLWSIHELFAQEERVKKGWYPAKPKKDPIHTKTKEKKE